MDLAESYHAQECFERSMATANFNLIRVRHVLPGGRLSVDTILPCSDRHVSYAARRKVRQYSTAVPDSISVFMLWSNGDQIDNHIRTKFRRAPQQICHGSKVRNRKFKENTSTDNGTCPFFLVTRLILAQVLFISRDYQKRTVHAKHHPPWCTTPD